MDAEKLKTIVEVNPNAILIQSLRTLTIVFIFFNFFISFNFYKLSISET